MSILNSVLKVFVGDKKKKDLKELQPIVTNVRAFESQMERLSIDEIRGKTLEFKQKIKEARKPFDDKIAELNIEIETANIDRKEEIYKQIDLLNEDAYQASEGVLLDVQAEAFAVIKETAKRLVNNTTLKVKATPFDREISADNDYVVLEDDYAIWSNSWDAAGKPITWDMIHYDVQLIGGLV